MVSSGRSRSTTSRTSSFLETLLARAEPPARVVLVGSATHDPAQRSGLPAPFAASVERIARGGGGHHRSAGRRRYATSKLLVTALTPALARQHPDLHVSCLDPGLMTATGLSRESAAPPRRAFAALGPLVARLPFASTPERSAAVLASLLVDAPPPVPSGSVVDHRGRMARVSDRARDRAFQDDVLAQTLRLSHVVDEQVHL